MNEETTPEATTSEATPPEQDSQAPSARESGSAPKSTSDAVPAENGAASPARRRRRGSRGGRNRRKPSTATSTETNASAGSSLPAGTRPGDDWNDAAADRGLTSEDLAADAKDEAGLGSSPPSKPKIGDTRPAPTADTTKAPRRRRRGGRGRGRGGAAPSDARSSEPRTREGVVHADLGVGDGAALEDLDEETLARRRGRTRKGRPAGRYLMCVHVRPDGHTHIALLEGRSLIEHEVSAERDSDASIDGNIYLGRVQNVLPGMEAAFVDIGTPKNGVLYRGDVAYDSDEIDEKQPRIERLLKNGQSVVVQVTKNPIGAKGARLTQEVSLAGRFVVMVPSQPDTYGISKRLPDDERKRLRRVLEGLRPPDAGLIVRTAAEGATADELERDVRRLREQWEQISALAARSKPGRLLYQEPPLVLRLLREEFTKEYRGVVIDDRALYEEVRAYVEAITPEMADRIE